MTTKEKLELVWKYLALGVVVYGIAVFGDHGFDDDDEHVFLGTHSNKLSSGEHGKRMEVKVEKEIVDGDTVVNVTVNGEPVDAASFEDSEHGMKWLSEDGEVHLFKMDGNKGEKKKVIKKMMKKKEHNR